MYHIQVFGSYGSPGALFRPVFADVLLRELGNERAYSFVILHVWEGFECSLQAGRQITLEASDDNGHQIRGVKED